MPETRGAPARWSIRRRRRPGARKSRTGGCKSRCKSHGKSHGKNRDMNCRRRLRGEDARLHLLARAKLA